MCFGKKDKEITGKHRKPERVKVILGPTYRTKAQKKFDKKREKERREILARIARENDRASRQRLANSKRKRHG